MSSKFWPNFENMDFMPKVKSVHLIVLMWSFLGMLSQHDKSKWTDKRLRLSESGPFNLSIRGVIISLFRQFLLALHQRILRDCITSHCSNLKGGYI
jgi:hypothetical protein